MERSPMLIDYRIIIFKMAILSKANYTFIALPIKIPTKFFTELERAIWKFIWNNKSPRIAKTILNNKRTSGGNTMPDLKQLHRTIEIKSAWYWYSDRQTNGMELKTQKWTHTPMVTWSLTKKLKPSSGKNTAFSTNGAGKNWQLSCRRMWIDPFLSPCTMLKSKWIKELHIKPETLKFIEEKVGKSLKDMGTGGKFLNRRAMACAVRSRIDKWDLIKL